MNEQQTGQCLCGAVRFRLTKPVREVGACHCGMCRRWAGGPFLVVEHDQSVAFEGEANISRYKSSQWAERGFCRICGANLFYRLTDGGKYYLSAGALDEQSDLALTSQVFIDEKPAWYAFANETTMMTGAELFALFAPKK